MNKNETMPSNVELEQALLGAIMYSTNRIYEAKKYLTKKDFYHETNGKIFGAMIDIADKQGEINIITLGDYFKGADGILSYLAGIQQKGMDFRSVENLAKKVKGYALKRWAIEFFMKMTETAYSEETSELLTRVGSELATKYRETGEETGDPKEILKELEKIQDENIERFKKGEKYLGIPIGLEKIDKILEGIQRNKLYLLNAYTSVGKSMMALNWARGFLKEKKRVVFFSLEMPSTDIMARQIGMEAGINSISVLRGGYKENEAEMKAKAILYDSNLKVYFKKRNLDEIVTTMISENLEEPVDLFVIDYLQHIKNDKARDRYEKYTEASNQLQVLAQDLGVPVLLLSQIDNDSAKSRQTDVIATKGSGDVPADAEVAILLQNDKSREDCYQEGYRAVNFIIQKNRGGMTGKVELIMDTRTGIFYDSEEYGKITRD